MAQLSVVDIDGTGINDVDVTSAAGDLSAADGSGDSYPNDDHTFFLVSNQGAAPCIVTVTQQRTSVRKEGFGQPATESVTITVPITTGVGVLKAPLGSHSDANGRVQVTYDQVTSVFVGAFRAKRQ